MSKDARGMWDSGSPGFKIKLLPFISKNEKTCGPVTNQVAKRGTSTHTAVSASCGIRTTGAASTVAPLRGCRYRRLPPRAIGYGRASRHLARRRCPRRRQRLRSRTIVGGCDREERRPDDDDGAAADQNILNLIWSYPSNGRADGETFRAWIPAALLAVLDDGCDVRSMTSIAWAYAVLDVSAPSLFGEDFAASCLGRQDELDVDGMRQLYQWHLWQAEELGIGATGLPPLLGGGCYRNFLSTPPGSVGVAERRHLGAQSHRPTSRLRGAHEEGVPSGRHRRGGWENDRH